MIAPGKIAYYWNSQYPTPLGTPSQPYVTNASGATWGSSGAVKISPGSVLHAFVQVPTDAGTQQAFTNWVVYSDLASPGGPDFTFLDRADDNSVGGSAGLLQFRSNGPFSGSRVFSLFDTLSFESGRQQFMGLIVVEIKSPLSNVPDGHNAALQSITGTTADSITCSAIKSTGIGQPALILSATNDSTALSSPTVASAGTGFIDLGAYCLFDGVNPFIRVECKRITGVTGTQAATFTPPGSDTFETTTAIYSEAINPPPGRWGRRNRRSGGLSMDMNVKEWF